jgi:hypothetical protein
MATVMEEISQQVIELAIKCVALRDINRIMQRLPAIA